ncbi:MAG TPA: universal stress protein, partial [Nocardioides sp.]|nr:universal stress protein [Nocardioides sp.]
MREEGNDMWDMKPPKVLVGVDRPDCEAALQYAVAEARRRGCGIHLVHVARPILASRALDDIALVDGELRETSRVLLARAAARTQQLIDAQDPDDERLSVSTEVTHGSVVAMLHSLSAHAALLVMEHQGMGRHGETPTLSVTAGVAAVAQCPVVAVPDSWRPTAGIGGAVVVGISDPERDRAVVEEARNEAERRRTDLVVVGPATDPMLAEELLRSLHGLLQALKR